MGFDRSTTMSVFATAAPWLEHIGSAPTLQANKKDLGIVHELHTMKDAETKGGVHALPPPRHTRRNGRNLAAHQHQPQPKTLAHKDPTRGKKKKDKAKSNRSGRVSLSR